MSNPTRSRKTDGDQPHPLHAVVRRRRMTHAEAVQAEMKRWRLYHGEDALILAFCACVGMKMKGGDMDDMLQPPNSDYPTVSRISKT